MPQPLYSSADRISIARAHGIKNGLLFYTKRIRLRYSSKKRGADCLITYEQYAKLAERAGITDPDQIGKSPGQYQMGRKKDTGDYTIRSARFVTVQENHDDLTRNGGRARGDRKRSQTLTGRTKETHPYLREMGNKRGYRFELVSPKGKVYQGKNVRAFCEKHNLCPEGVYAFLNGGKMKHHKGWTGRYL